MTTGAVNPISQTSTLSSTIRNTSASASPIWRARVACGSGTRETSTDRKITLSMPSTTSSAVKVTSAAQASALVNSSIIDPPDKDAPDRIACDHVGGDDDQG